MEISKARISDVTEMHRLINFFANKNEMLPRPLSEIYENIRDYFVIRKSGQVVACAAIHISWSDLAEVRSLAVNQDYQKQGVGVQLVEACLDEAKELGLATVFCLTYHPAFFEKLGFQQVDKAELPHKIWAECFHCHKFPNCDEVALVYRFGAEA